MLADDYSAPEVWPETVTSQDVTHFALRRFAFFVAKWGVAELMKNEAEMKECALGIVIIATRMEDFRRMRAKQWAAATAANSKQGETPK